MKSERLLRRLSEGAVTNVRFDDLIKLVGDVGFELRRVTGGHYLFVHPQLPQNLNLQEIKGEAKPYQIRQFLRLVERYDLRIEGR